MQLLVLFQLKRIAFIFQQKRWIHWDLAFNN